MPQVYREFEYQLRPTGKRNRWEWTVYRKKGDAVPLCKGVIEGARRNAVQAAKTAIDELIRQGEIGLAGDDDY